MKWRGLDEAKTGFQNINLKATLDERRDLMRKYVPSDVQGLNRSVVEQLRDSCAADRILPVGAIAPPFTLPDHNGRTVDSNLLLQCGPLVLIFIRGRWCPFCVAQVEAWSAMLPNVQSRGVSLVAISPQTAHQCSLMHDQHGLRFPLLSDTGNVVARQFGLVYRVPEEQQQVYSRTFVNLPFINGDSSWELPLPATYVLGPGGPVQYASADADYTVRPEPADVLAAII